MTPAVTFSDTAKAVRDFLRDSANFLGVDAERIALGSLRSKVGVGPQIVVTRVGGGDDPSEAPVDRALLQIDIWGRKPPAVSYNETANIKGRVRALLKELRTSEVSTTTVLYGADVVSEIFLPDEGDNTPRFAMTVAVSARAAQ